MDHQKPLARTPPKCATLPVSSTAGDAMTDYRQDNQSRCVRCETRVSHEQLSMTTDGHLLCRSCHAAWLLARKDGVEPGHRLVCPTCKAATMPTTREEFVLRATCARCGHRTSRMQSLAFLSFFVVCMLTVFADFVVRAPYFTSFVCAAFMVLVVRDLLARWRHPVATFEQIEAADHASSRQRLRALAVAEPAVEADAESEAEAEAEAETKLRPREAHDGR